MPANGTAGLARSAVNGISRFPSPPARTIARTLRLGSRLMPPKLATGGGSVDHMRVDVLSKEYPPEVYGGAGVHVAELVRALRRLPALQTHVHAFGAVREEQLTASYADLA